MSEVPRHDESGSAPGSGEPQPSPDTQHTLNTALRRIESLNLTRARLEARLEAKSVECDADMSSLRSELQAAQLRHRQATESLADARERLDLAKDQIEALMGTIEQHRGQIAAQGQELASLQEKLAGAWARLSSNDEEIDELQSQLAASNVAAQNARDQLARITGSRAWKAVSRYRELKTSLDPRSTGPAPSPGVVTSEPDPAPALAPAEEEGTEPVTTSQSDQLMEQFDTWVEQARAASGEQVVFMFSGTTYVQEHRANRPIRLTRVYLGRHDPVFFNYYRWDQTDPLPVHDDALLIQSPIDLTATLIDDLLAADFGSKTKVMFASFPHELMVRNIARAQQHGWTVIYDARDDWEEFAKVGAAKWYDLGYERYVARQADLVTAVSWPLARKIEALSGRAVTVNANAADPDFPKSPTPRAPAWPPTVGYFGHLTDKWFDWELVRLAAQSYPDWRFELAGHQAPGGLKVPDNVRLLGLRSHAELAELSTRWALGIIPFKTGALADGVDPIKVYEYLQLGLPVLATYFPQMRDYPGVWLAHSHDDFVQKLPSVARAHLDLPAVDAYLRENTWPERVHDYDRRVEGLANASDLGSLNTLLGRPA